MKPDARNIIITALLVATSLGIGRTGFVWHERLEEQAARIGDLEKQVLETRKTNDMLARNLAATQSGGFLSKKALPTTEPISIAVIPDAPVSQAPDVDVAFLQSVVEQLSQNQQAIGSKPKTVQKTVSETPQTRSRTTRAS